jgi:Rv0078B-related antitoxin
MAVPNDAAARFRLALDLFATGVAMKRQQLRRDHPQWSNERIEDSLATWLRERPGAEDGDAQGRPVAWTDRSA